MTWMPQDTVAVDNERRLKLMDHHNEHDDVQSYANFGLVTKMGRRGRRGASQQDRNFEFTTRVLVVTRRGACLSRSYPSFADLPAPPLRIDRLPHLFDAERAIRRGCASPLRR